MKMKALALFAAVSLFLCGTASAADLFSITTALTVQETQQSYTIPLAVGEVLEFSCKDLERRLGITQLDGITITALPKAEQGELILDGVEVGRFEFLDRAAIDRLCFVPNESAAFAGIGFIPKSPDAQSANLAIQVLEQPNSAPEIQGESYSTIRNVAISGQIDTRDPEGDSIKIKVIRQPVNGTVRFEGTTFFYTPYKNVSGKDSFTVCAIDAFENYSPEATVKIAIEKGKSTFFYADMINHPSAYAAIKLRENKVYSGTQVSGAHFLYPQTQMTRGQFLVLLLAGAGMDKNMKATINTGLPNDVSIPAWLKPYLQKAIDEKIWPLDTAFAFDEIPIRAEAVVLTDRAAKIFDVKDYALQIPDLGRIPDWALPSYKDLGAYKMLDLYGGGARPNDALTNSYAVDLVWQLYKHTHR